MNAGSITDLTGGSNEDDDSNTPVCRYCLVGGDDLISPCSCKGSSKWCHLVCLKQWQKSVLLTQSTHPKYQTRIDAICNVCNKPFKEQFRPKERSTAVLEYTGTEIVKHMIKGNLLVSSEKDSRESAETMEKHPEIAPQLAHWTYAVFFIVNEVKFEINPKTGKTKKEGSVMAVNLTAPIKEPPKAANANLPGERYRRSVSPYNTWLEHYKSALESSPYLSGIQHFIGGPVEPDEALCLTELGGDWKEVLFGVKEKADDDIVSNTSNSNSRGVSRSDSGSSFFARLSTSISNALPLPGSTNTTRGSSSMSSSENEQLLRLAKALHVRDDLFFGDPGMVLTLIAGYCKRSNTLNNSGAVTTSTSSKSSLSSSSKSKFKTTVPLKLFWGYAAWNATQLLAEVAKRHWGFSAESVSIREGAVKWDNYYEEMYMAKESEYSKQNEG